jgi:hypothetical protein
MRARFLSTILAATALLMPALLAARDPGGAASEAGGVGSVHDGASMGLPAAAAAIRSDGGVVKTDNNNWAGYALVANKVNQFTGIIGNWRVPTVTAEASGSYYASDWVGIDGYLDKKKLVQAGTTEQSVNGKAEYYAWTEILPAGPLKAGFQIHPGDYITVEIQKYAGSNQWNLSIADNTTQISSNRTVNYTTPGQSAEAVHERPTIDHSLSMLAQTSNVKFSSVAVPEQGNWVALNSGIPGTTLHQLFMFNHIGGTGIASPSMIQSGACFTVADGSKSPPSGCQ